MEDVEVMRLLLGIDRRRQRVDYRLAHPVGNCKQNHPDIQAVVTSVLAHRIEDGSGSQGDYR
jgi:hypothetical protein